MAFTTNQPTNSQDLASTTANQPTRNRGLRAQWQMIDGKLVCKWFACPD